MRRTSAVALIVAVAVILLVALVVKDGDSATLPVEKKERPVSRAAETQLKVLTSEAIVATWTCQTQLGVPRSQVHSPWKPHSMSFRREQLNKWRLNRTACLTKLHRRADVQRAIQAGALHRLTTDEVYEAAEAEVRNGGIYSIAWGGASRLLQSLCYEALNRTFGPNARWARYIVNRESGCNPRATNTTYSSWDQQAKCIAQLIPAYHKWVDFPRCQRDLRYSVWVFWRLSRGGTSTGPWSM